LALHPQVIWVLWIPISVACRGPSAPHATWAHKVQPDLIFRVRLF